MISPSDKIAIISGDRKISFKEMLQHVQHHAQQINYGKGDRVLILSENREGWIYAFYSIWTNHGIAVPVDAASTAADVAYIINDCHPSAMWVSKGKMAMAREAFCISGVEVPVCCIDDYETADVALLNTAVINCEMKDTCIICYTSGTTGSPKGVMLSYENVWTNIDAVTKHVEIFTPDLRTLILLPLHHVLPLVGTCVMPLVCGGGVAICPSLAGPKIMEVLQNAQVGLMVGVPRLWQTLYRGIKSKIDANALTKALYNVCDFLQCRALSRLVFSSVHKKMGGRMKYMVSGGAALDMETARGLKTLGLGLLEGYGMTEAAPMISFTRPDNVITGTVGLPIPGCEVTLIDGEICARGANIMQGYYGRLEETADVIDENGFLHTGDLGTIDRNGIITITGRKKEIIVLSNGKNVNPNELEEKLEHYSDYVKEAAVTFADDKLVAIVVPSDNLAKKSLEDIKTIIRQEVLHVYNGVVAPYKKITRLHIHLGELPRTRLEKLQRYKLQQMIVE